jgi:TPR repeat protein
MYRIRCIALFLLPVLLVFTHEKTRADEIEQFSKLVKEYGCDGARNHLRSLADKQDAEAEYEVGNSYYVYPLGTYPAADCSRDEREAAKWYRMAAEHGSAEGASTLASFFVDGTGGVPRNFQEAMKWYRIAAERGSSGAMFILGLHYYNGVGILQDFKEAAEWNLRAAERGYFDAQVQMGGMYEFGIGEEVNYIEAYKWLNIACSNDHAYGVNLEAAIKIRTDLASKMTRDQVLEAQKLSKELKVIQ